MFALAGVLGISGVLALALVLRSVLGRGQAPADAEATQAISAPSAAPVVASALPIVTAAPPLVEPVVTATATAPTTAPATATARAIVSVPKQAPVVAAPKSPGASKPDPFGGAASE